MARREDIESILIIGSGPIVIGQACEFDYSGTQACRVLRNEGYKVILVNSNPATIMTDPAVATKTYIEPLVPEVLTAIIEKESPDAILPTLGGQTALNLAMDLYNSGVLKRAGIELIGASPDAIKTAEDRQAFKDAMIEIGLDVPISKIAANLDEALDFAEQIGFPLMIRPSFILGGLGTAIAKNIDEFKQLAESALRASPIGEILIEQSIAGWKEFELEVMRDKADNCVVICSIENFDPMGVHTGDSITVAPAQSLSDLEYQKMRDQAFSCIRKVGVETGGSNIQFAVNPKNGEMKVIEMNPRVSRSSALASKATGFPIAKIAAKLAVGYLLEEIPNDITKKTPACFEPVIDYVVTKIPRWAFEKLPGARGQLGTSMQSVGEAMAIGKTFAESLQKAIRSLEIGRAGLNADFSERQYEEMSSEDLIESIKLATPNRVFQIEAAIRRGIEISKIYEASSVDPWFLYEIKRIVDERSHLENLDKNAIDRNDLIRAKRSGFSDGQIAYLTGSTVSEIEALRGNFKVKPVFKTVDTCSGEFEANTPYHYSTFEQEDEVSKMPGKKVIILGSGPNRIGQGIEFDYCCVHAAETLRELGYRPIMINCNPETVSTDYDISDRLYFEPLDIESLNNIINEETQNNEELAGIILSLGGQTPLKLAGLIDPKLVLGTRAEAIDLAEDRKRWNDLCISLGLKQPEGYTALSLTEAEALGDKIGYPILIRPSYVLGGRAMEIVYNKNDLESAWQAIEKHDQANLDKPVLIDRFLEDALELDVDALRDSSGGFVIAGIMQHIEEAGIHSGDSACVVPSIDVSDQLRCQIESQTKKIADALSVVGPINVQFAIKKDQIYVLEANPRASRTLPFISKATGIQFVKTATKIMMGAKIKELIENKELPNINSAQNSIINYSLDLKTYAVKEAVLPFYRFPEVDSLLGPEMRSTGEVMGIDQTFGLAFYKSQLAAYCKIPEKGCVFYSLADKDKQAALESARRFCQMGLKIAATEGTAEFFKKNDIPISQIVAKRGQSQPGTSKDAVELISTGAINLVINTPRSRGAQADGAYIRMAASLYNVPCLTTLKAANAAAEGLSDFKKYGISVSALQEPNSLH
jgi:carbamoyl-phosphate synthase large subunit